MPATAQGQGQGDLTPPPVRVAGVLVGIQGLGMLALAASVGVSGFHHHAAVGQLLGQMAYFVVIGLAMLALGGALWLGKRWARTPVIVTQIVVVAIGYWLAVPSGRPVWGAGVILAGVITGGLLFLPASSEWVRSVPIPIVGTRAPAVEPVFTPDPTRPVTRRTPPKNAKKRPAGRRHH